MRQRVHRILSKTLTRFGISSAKSDKPDFSAYWAEERAYWSGRFTQTLKDFYDLDVHPIQVDDSRVPSLDLVTQIQDDQKAEIDVYFATGLRTALTHLHELRDHGLDPRQFGRILEMGVGLGRLIRHYFPFKAELFGCDVTPSVLDFVQRSLGDRVRTIRNDTHPPLPFNNESFDFVFANSVFTHIRFGETRAWIKELSRIVRPGGGVIVSVFNPDVHLAHLAPREFDGLVEADDYFEWGRDDTVRENYVFIRDSLLFELWSEHFRVLELRRNFKEQDHLILKKDG